jgi:peptidoglycan/LPS O-acetylase OafA/YrhL
LSNTEAAGGRILFLYTTCMARPAAVASLRLHDNNFDALRLAFASMVALFHLGVLSQVPSLAWTSHLSAAFAVQAFFFISGFLVTMSFETSSSVRSYASKRWRRIVPAYVAVVVGAALALSFISSFSFNQYFLQPEFWRYLAFNLLLANFSAPTLPGVFQSNFLPAVNGALWTIKIEVAFYAFVPLMVLATRRFGTQRTLLSIFVASIAWKLGFDTLHEVTGKDVYFHLAMQLPGQFAFFIGGAWAFHQKSSNKRPSALAAALGVVTYAATHDGLLFDLCAPIAVTAVVYWLATSRAVKLPATSKYGDLSYGIYLFHFPLIQTVIALGLFRRSPALGVTVFITSLLVAAAASWKFVEQPMMGKRVRPVLKTEIT